MTDFRSKLIKYFPYALVLLFIANPYFHVMDMWDGVMIDYAEAKGNYIGIRNWFFESEWHLQYWFVRGLLAVAKLTGVSYLSVNLIVLAVLLCVLVREIAFIADRLIRLERPWKALALFYVGTSTILAVFYSSVMTFYLVCMCVGLWAVRWIHAPEKSKRIIGHIAVIPALSLQSLLVFLPVLSFVYDWEKSSFKQNLLKTVSLRTLFLFVSIVIFFFGYRLLLPKIGLYADYNQIGADGASGVKALARNVAKYLTFLLPLFFLFLVDLLSAVRSVGVCARVRQLISGDFSRFALILAALFFAAIFPYIAVGKSVTLYDWHEWGQRQALLLLLPLSLLVGYAVQRMVGTLQLSKKQYARLVALVFVFVALTNGSFLVKTVMERVSRQIFSQQLEMLIQQNVARIPPGVVEIRVDGRPQPPFAAYESNYLMFRATGKANWWSTVTDRDNPEFLELIDAVKASREYQIKYVYDYDPAAAPCRTQLVVEATGFVKFFDQLKLLITRDTEGTSLRMIRLDASCS